MEITSRFEGIYHLFALSHVGQDSELKLSVVCNDELITLLWLETHPYFILVLIKSWLVLKVRFPRT